MCPCPTLSPKPLRRCLSSPGEKQVCPFSLLKRGTFFIIMVLVSVSVLVCCIFWYSVAFWPISKLPKLWYQLKLRFRSFIKPKLAKKIGFQWWHKVLACIFLTMHQKYFILTQMLNDWCNYVTGWVS